MNIQVKTFTLVAVKIAGMLFLTFLIAGILGIIPMVFFGIKPQLGHPTLAQSIVMSSITLVAGGVVSFNFRTQIEGKKMKDIGFRFNNMLQDTWIGLLLGAGIILAGFIVLRLSNVIYISLNDCNYLHISLWLLSFVLAGAFEEILCRGYILTTLAEAMPQKIALLLSAFLFAIMHGGNLSFGWIPMLNLTLAGILLGQSYLYTRSLYMPIILHASWNFFQGPVFGFKVSGETVSDTIFQLTCQPDNLINGGRFGFEGSLVCLVLQILAIAALYFWNKKHPLYIPKTKYETVVQYQVTE